MILFLFDCIIVYYYSPALFLFAFCVVSCVQPFGVEFSYFVLISLYRAMYTTGTTGKRKVHATLLLAFTISSRMHMHVNITD